MDTLTSDRKLIVSKDRIEFFSYHHFYQYGQTKRTKNPENQKKSTPSELYMTDEQILARRERYRLSNRIRSQQNLVRLVNTNKTYDRGRHSFLTLTYHQLETNIPKAQREFAKFIQRLNYYLLVEKNIPKLKYVGVIEFQERGAIHFHVILFDVPFIHFQNITKLWPHGSIDIRAKDKAGRALTVTKIAIYMGKYMAKAFTDTRLDSKKKYFGSRNLERPLIFREPAHVDFIRSNLPAQQVTYTKEYYSRFMGHSLYVVYEELTISEVNFILSLSPPPGRYEYGNNF